MRCCPASAAAVTSTAALRAMWPCPLNLFVSCNDSSRTLVNVPFLLDCDRLSPLFFVASNAGIVNPPLTLSVDVDVWLTLCFDLLGSVGLLFVGVLLNFSVCLFLRMWWLRKHLLCHLQLFTLIGINTISWHNWDSTV